MPISDVGYYALPVIPSLKGAEKTINAQLKGLFNAGNVGKAGQQAGQTMGAGIASGLRAAESKTVAAAARHSKAIDKVATAGGQARVEILKLNEALAGGASGSKLEAQSERVARALRNETQAARDAKRAETELANARRGQSAAGAGIGNPLKTAEQGMTSSGSGLASVAGGIGTKVGTAFMASLGAVASVAAVGALFKSAFDTGLDFERAVNTFAGVTASGTEGANKMREAARGLGTDVSLAGVGARDAADAMVELAKGGMTADQAMQAARGTLQLATAGQLDAAEAAKIQSAALNTWQLGAGEATHVADLLAAGANASSADVHDLGLAMSQGGAVAAGFGVNIQDTVTALTLFSKWGINGSDAGTMLKTSLLAITDQGNPAQGAIEELGLKLYDATGKFVGVESMMKQVGEASKHMTQEQFQAATAVLFGSDAMRASMVAANGGAEAWDSTATAVNRTGAAADMASAQMQGLPGVVESLSNLWEGFKLKLFDVIDGPLISIGNWFTAALSGGGPQWVHELGDGFKAFGGVLRDNLMPALKQLWENIKGPLMQYGKQWLATFKEAWPVIKAVGMVIGGVLIGAIKALSITLPIAINLLTGVISVGQKVYAVIKGGAGVFMDVANVIKTVFVGAWNLGSAAMSTAWGIIKPIFDGFKAAFGFLGDAARYVWDTVLSPIFHDIGIVFGAVWEQIRPIFDFWKSAWQGIAEAVSEFWHGTIEPAWEGIKIAFQVGWAAIQPIFQNIKDAFQGVRDFVSTVWSGLAGVVKGAFDAVINAVKGPLHSIGNLLQKVPTSIGSFEIPGAAAAVDLGNTLAGLARGGKAGRTKGGRLWGPGSGTSDSIMGVDQRGRPTALVSAGEGVVTKWAMDRGGASIVAGLNAGFLGGLAGLKGGGKVPGFVDPDEHARMGGGTINESILSALRAVNAGAKLVSAKTDHDDDGGFHPRGMAIDVDPSSANLSALWAMRDKLTQIIFDDPAKVWYNVGGQRAEGAAARKIYGETTMSQHRDHIHVAAAALLEAPTGRPRGARGSLPALSGLANDATPEEIARHIAAEGMRRGYTTETIIAAIAAGLKESGLSQGAVNTEAGIHSGVFQMSSDKKGRETAAGQITWFYDMLDKLGGPGGIGDPFSTIADKVEVGGYSGQTLSSEKRSQAQELYNRVSPDLTVESPQVTVNAGGAAGPATADTGGGGGADSKDKLGEVGSIFSQFLKDTFGFGDLLPDPSELGIVKLAQALMGIKYTPQGTGFAGGLAANLFATPEAAIAATTPGGGGQGAAAEAAPTGSGLPFGMIPGVSSMLPSLGQQPMQQPTGPLPGPAGGLDQSTNIIINNPQGDEQSIANRTRKVILNTPRLATYTPPGS